MVNELFNLIEKYEDIIIFRHTDGDGDALGSQWGMYYFLKETYPNKNIYVVGDETLGYKNLFPKMHEVSDDVFKNALAIILDTANTERISDERYKLVKEIVKIDHHLPTDNYGDINIVDEKRASCAEIVTDIIKEYSDSKVLSTDVANCLYLGIISDTQGFSTTSVSSKTFESASYLMQSQINPSKLSDSLRAIDLNLFKFQSQLFHLINYVDDHLAYIQINQSLLNEYNLTVSEVKRFVNIMRNIEGISVWVLFIEQDDRSYSASIRSSNVNINQVAKEYNGGGHLHASGVKGLNETTINSLLNDLSKVIN